jgi:hypothetical protein
MCNVRSTRLSYKALEWAGGFELPEFRVATGRFTPFSHTHKEIGASGQDYSVHPCTSP